MKTVPVEVEKTAKKAKEFLTRKGIKVYKIHTYHWGRDGSLIEIHTNLRSTKKALQVTDELHKAGIETDEISIIVLPKD